jgi:hypothetical protein
MKGSRLLFRSRTVPKMSKVSISRPWAAGSPWWRGEVTYERREKTKGMGRLADEEEERYLPGDRTWLNTRMGSTATSS